jgi:WXG100 family type VII secretion target
MTNDGGMVYDFGGIESISARVKSFVDDMNNTLGEVDSEFGRLLANGWSGSGARAFEAHSRKWHGQATQMAETLTRLAHKVSNAGSNMLDADNRAAASFDQ